MGAIISLLIITAIYFIGIIYFFILLRKKTIKEDC